MTRRRFGMGWVWFLLGLLLFIGGVVGVVIGDGHKAAAGAGVVIMGVAAMVWLLGWLSGMNRDSSRDREKEDEAREYFTEHGHWPDEGGR
jgi:hypothetical protein